MRNYITIRKSVYFMLFIPLGCKENNSQHENPNRQVDTQEGTKEVNKEKNNEGANLSLEKCALANGTWNTDAKECFLAKPILPYMWKEFENQFGLKFQANVTGENLNPYLDLYIIPEVNQWYKCENSSIKAGYVERISDTKTLSYISKDCIFKVTK